MTKSIKIKTWRCKYCNYAQDFESNKKLNKLHFSEMDLETDQCPSCHHKQAIGLEIDPEKQSTMNIMSEQDIEIEIKEIQERKEKGEEFPEDIDLSTPEKIEEYRQKRRQDIAQAVKKGGLKTGWRPTRRKSR